MNTLKTRVQNEKLILDILDSKYPIYLVFPVIDPYSVEFKKQFRVALDEIAKGVWDSISTVFSNLTPKDRLANSWAISLTNTDWLLLLYRVGVTSNDINVKNEAIRLGDAFKDTLKQNILADCVLNLDDASILVPPDLSTCVPLKPGIRLRYSLASKWVNGAKAIDLYKTAFNQKNATPYLKIRELKKALNANNKTHPSVGKLSKTDFLMLKDLEQEFLLADASLVELLIPDELNNIDLNAARKSALQEVIQIKSQLNEIRAFVLNRLFPEASQLLKKQLPTEFTKKLFKEIFGELQGLIEPELLTTVSWRPLDPEAIQIWKELNGTNNLPICWCKTPQEIAGLICTKKLPLHSIPEEDLKVISQSWDESCYENFGKAGLNKLIPGTSVYWDQLTLKEILKNLKDHPEFNDIVKTRLSKGNIKEFSEFITSYFGTKSIDALEQAIGYSQIRSIRATTLGVVKWDPSEKHNYKYSFSYHSILEMRDNGYEPLSPEDFHRAIAPILLEAHTQRLESWQARRTGIADTKVPEYLQKDPHAIKNFYPLIPRDELIELLNYEGYTLAVLDTFKRLLPEEFQTHIWHCKLLKTKTYSSLQKLLLQRITKTGAVPWNKGWLELKGTPKEKATSLVLATLRNTAKLRKLIEILGEKQFLIGLNGALKELPAKAKRDIGYLELIKVLGNDEIPYLAAVMSMMDASQNPGHKLDAAYYNYLLPKKSGGNRVISSPHRFLKRVQRVILDKLIQPLGAHPCAYGFVQNRSIGGNALNHINNPIVTNSDISNCFPSVKWPLVLGVLRRDLGKKLSPGAISILLDICTSNGGLPIGAPTSPALLNRVLYKSDEILHAAATSLNCKYSRYADDMTFSGDHGAVKLLGITKRTLSQIGLNLDEKKTNIYRKGRRQIVTGLVVNEKVSVPRRLRKRMRAAVHAVEQGKTPTWHSESESVQSLEGRLAFLNSIDPKQAKPLVDRLHKAKAKKN